MSLNADRYGDPYSPTGGTAGDATGRPPAPSGTDEGATGSVSAARLLEITARETDQWRSEARGEAATIVEEARREAAELVRAARAEAERVVTKAQEESAQATNGARVEAYRVREETTAVRRRHEEEVARLQQAATEHRELMRNHLTAMLEQVDSLPGESTP
jgi:cell division septum initiation protein DivIVA